MVKYIVTIRLIARANECLARCNTVLQYHAPFLAAINCKWYWSDVIDEHNRLIVLQYLVQFCCGPF